MASGSWVGATEASSVTFFSFAASSDSAFNSVSLAISSNSCASVVGPALEFKISSEIELLSEEDALEVVNFLLCHKTSSC